jgi:hypothetical protein
MSIQGPLLKQIRENGRYSKKFEIEDYNSKDILRNTVASKSTWKISKNFFMFSFILYKLEALTQ